MTNTTAPRTPGPAAFARIVANLAAILVGTRVVREGAEWPFMIGYCAEVVAWVPRPGTLVLQLNDILTGELGEGGRALGTVAVHPGAERAYDVTAGDRLIIGETRGAPAAVSLALDHLIRPLRAEQQAEHDAFAV